MSDPVETERNEATWQVMSLLKELLRHGGWLSTADLATRCGMHRDSARRHLRTLATDGWVRCESSDGRDLWTLGPELPRIGVQYQELLVRRQAAVRADWDRLAIPPKGE